MVKDTCEGRVIHEESMEKRGFKLAYANSANGTHQCVLFAPCTVSFNHYFLRRKSFFTHLFRVLLLIPVMLTYQQRKLLVVLNFK